MKKLGQWALLFAMLGAFFWYGSILVDRGYLRTNLVRLHVVADSDFQEDQAEKLLVRDAILDYLGPEMEALTTAEAAKDFIRAHLTDLEQLANETLRSAGSRETADVTLALEHFPQRVYDTFSLPSGVYESLRVVIGSGKGHNWWCVVFPQLCLPATGDGFEAAATASGFPEELADTLAGNAELRFYLLDCLGKLENFFFEP